MAGADFRNRSNHLKGTSKNPFLGSARIGFTGLAGERGI
jgi:hypothetical protein